MRMNQGEQESLEGSNFKELRLLEEVESSSEVSQRQLAGQLNIALGVANLIVRTLVRKGYLRASKVHWKRWVYVLTPAGIAHKVQLTLDYIERFVDHYRRVRSLLRTELTALAIDSDSRVAIYGTTEFAEMIFLALRELGVQHIDFFDSDTESKQFLGQKIFSVREISSKNYAVILVAHTAKVSSKLDELRSEGISKSSIVTPLQGKSISSLDKEELGQGNSQHD